MTRGLAFVLVLAVLALLGLSGSVTPAMADPGGIPRGDIGVLAPPAIDAAFVGMSSGTSVVLLEATTGQIIASRDADRRRPIASAIKLVTALAVIDALPPGTVIVVGEEARGVEGSSYGLRVGDVRTVEDLLAGLLLRSGNDAAIVLAHAVDGNESMFVLRMQAVLQRLGIEATPASATGLELGDALSASELATVAIAALREPRIRDLVGRTEFAIDGTGTIENRNLFIQQFAGATGLKTGYTSAAGYTLAASARRDDRELVAVVLGSPDDLARRATAARLLDFGFDQTRLAAVERSVTLRTSSGPVRFGTDSVAVTLRNGESVAATWPATLRPDDTIHQIEIGIDGRSAGFAPVVRRDARSAVEAPGLGKAFADGVYGALRPYGLIGALR